MFRISYLKPHFWNFLDEAGDFGFKFDKGSSEWFILCCIMVEEPNLALLPPIVSDLMHSGWGQFNQSPPDVLHWKELDHYRKQLVAARVNIPEITVIGVCIWKKWLINSWLDNPETLYSWTSQLVMERIGYYVHARNGTATVVFSKLTDKISKHLLAEMPKIIQSTRPVFDLERIHIRRTQDYPELQIADAYAGMFHNAVIPSRYGFCSPYYLDSVKPRLMSYNGKQFGYGFKVFPTDKLGYNPAYTFISKVA
jgi:hypothetical protein